MKTFDIFADKRLIKSDLFVIDLPYIKSTKKRSFDIVIGKNTIRCDMFVTDMPMRDDIAAFCGIVFGSNVDSIISEKAFYCDDESCSVVVNAFVNSAAIKNIFIDESHIDINAEAKLTKGFALIPNTIYVTIEQSIREAVKKLISAQSIIELGVTESLFILPMKSLGKYENITCVNTSTRFAKTSYLTQHDEIELCSQLKNPTAIVFTSYENSICANAEIRDINFLVDMLGVDFNIIVDANIYDVDIYGSVGRCESRIDLCDTVAISDLKFIGFKNELVIDAISKENIEKYISADDECEVSCSADISMRRFRTLEDADGLGTLENIDSMVLDDLYYINID